MNRGLKSIRPLRDGDETAVVHLWHRAGRAAYTYLPGWQTFTLERAGQVFRDVIRAQSEIWVGTQDDRIIAYLAMKGSYIDRMYVDPDHWRQGWGAQLIAHAKSISPTRLELHTHQENRAARKLYEKHDFRTVKFGISPPPESAPDVEYVWTPEVE